MNDNYNYEMDALSAVSTEDLKAALAAGNTEEQASISFPAPLTCNWEEVKKAISILIPDGNLFEIRTIPKEGEIGWRVCVKNTAEGLDTAISGLIKKGLDKTPLYMTLQAVQQDAKCLHDYGKVLPSRCCVKDNDIAFYQWLYIDIDPKRPSGMQATEDETEHAKTVADQVMEYLRNNEFPDPVYAFTGNGRAIYYSINMPADAENKQLISGFLKALHHKFSTEGADIDTTVSNPARITKVIGCPSCKGEETPERPYSMSKLLSVPAKIGTVSAEQLQAVIDALTPKREPKRTKKEQKADERKKTAMIADVKAWLDHYNIVYKESTSQKDDKITYKYELEDCPFNAHPNKYCSAIFWESNGKTTFNCFHNSCQEYTIHDVLHIYPLVNQIPLFNGDDPKMEIYNEIVKNCKFLVSQDNRKFLLSENSKLMWFDGAETDRYITGIGKQTEIMTSKTSVATIHLNLDALFDEYGVKVYVADRVAFIEGKLYYNLDCNKVVEVSQGKADVTNNPCTDVFFYENDVMLPQCEPDLSIPASELPSLIKQTFNVPDDQLLQFIGTLIGFYLPHIPTPLLVLSGGQGTSKTVSCKKIMSLVDPVIGDVSSLPDKEDSLYTALSTNYLSAFDNVASLSNAYSDAMCMAITGAYAKKRKLFTDNQQVIMHIQSKLMINGIGDLIKKTDLAERRCVIYPDIIKPSDRLTEKDVWDKFNKMKPFILGAVFNAIAGGLSNYSGIKDEIKELPRLADYTVYAAACIKAMGLKWEDFVKDYKQATNALIGEQMELDDLTILLESFLSDCDNNSWSGMPSELLKLLQKISSEKRIPMDKYSASSLSRKLGQMSVSLDVAGINYSKCRKGKRIAYLSMNSKLLTGNEITDTEQDDEA